jgi:hypothetical protein
MVHGPFPIRVARLLVGLMLLPLSSVVVHNNVQTT